jgi:hypothetical protein
MDIFDKHDFAHAILGRKGRKRLSLLMGLLLVTPYGQRVVVAAAIERGTNTAATVMAAFCDSDSTIWAAFCAPPRTPVPHGN